MNTAERLDGLQFSGIRKMFEMARPDSVQLAIGEPDFQPPAHVLEALADATRAGHNKYGSTWGLPALREALAERLRPHRPDITSDNILITVSATGGLQVVSQSLLDPGSEILIPDPGFVLYGPQASLAGAQAVPYALAHENGFMPDQDELLSKLTPRTKAIVVNTPSNPTGACFGPSDVKMVCDIAEDNGLTIISDEVYDAIYYGERHHTFLGKIENVIHVNSFSKTYAMTGWRLGYLAAPAEMVKKMGKIQYYSVACPPTPFQHAALAAVQGPQLEVERRREVFRRRKDLIVRLINDIPGFHCIEPTGAFYAFPKFDMDIPSKELAMRLLDAGVVCAYGTAFGENGEGHIRFSYAASEENIEKGIAIVKSAVEALAELKYK